MLLLFTVRTQQEYKNTLNYTYINQLRKEVQG